MKFISQDASKINNIKREISKYFAMKDLELVKQILV